MAWLPLGFLTLVMASVILLYVSARVFITVESFISIRKLPLGVYVTVNWANYFPHL